jgi:hypothetical protein
MRGHVVLLQAKQTVVGFLQRLTDLSAPFRVRAVSGSQDEESFAGCPSSELYEVTILGRGPGPLRMNVEIGKIQHI